MMSHYAGIINIMPFSYFNMEGNLQYFAGMGYRNTHSISPFLFKIHVYACKEKNSRVDIDINAGFL